MEVRKAQPQQSNRPIQTKPTHSIRAAYKKPGALIATLIVLVLGGFAAWYFLIPHGQRVDTNGYQIVYLSSGQTYFGKLQNTNGDYLELKTPYTAQDVQQPTGSKKSTVTTPQTTIVKLRDQVYGPDDSIALRSDQVLFWQNLRDDSKVVSAIKAKQ